MTISISIITYIQQNTEIIRYTGTIAGVFPLSGTFLFQLLIRRSGWSQNQETQHKR